MSQAFALRHHVFVDEKGWEALRKPDGLETDQFDHAFARHLLLLDQGRVAVYSRILPTEHPHLLADVYPYMAPFGIPRGPTIWEWTRLCIAPAARGDGSWCCGSGQMLRAVVELCLDHGVEELTWQGHPDWVLRFERLGLKARPLAPPCTVDREYALAASTRIDSQALSQLIARGIPAVHRRRELVY